MSAWMIWVAIGIICVIIEIFTPGFFFLSFGFGAIITGLLSLIVNGLAWQILIFAIITFCIFILMRKFSTKLISKEYEQTNVQALIRKKGKVTDEIPEDGRGHVKIGGEEWSAVSSDHKKIQIDTRVIVDKIEGNKVMVSPIDN